MLEQHTPVERPDRDLDVEIEGGSMPSAETCEGPDYTPEVRIKGLWAPYFALIMDDPSASQGGETLWIMWNIPRTDHIPRNIPKSSEVNFPIRAIQGRNDTGEIGYSGPCPPPGEVHEYDVRVYGLDEPLDLHPSSEREALEKAMSDHIIQYGQAQVEYSLKRELKIASGTKR